MLDEGEAEYGDKEEYHIDSEYIDLAKRRIGIERAVTFCRFWISNILRNMKKGG